MDTVGSKFGVAAKSVANREIDLAVVGGDIIETLNKSLETEFFVEDELIITVPKSNPFTLKKEKKRFTPH